MQHCFLGIDLTSSTAKPSPYVAIDDGLSLSLHGFFRQDAEIVSLAENSHPSLIAIDAPLGLPSGLCCLEESCPCQPISKEKGRSCERELAKRGIPCYFTTKKSIIKMMVYRGISLRRALENRNFEVIEVYPYASKLCLFSKPIPKKSSSAGSAFLREHLINLLPRLASYVNKFNHDLCDATMAAYTAYLHSLGETELWGITTEGRICVPRFRSLA